MGAGVAGALKARGGQSIESEAMAQGPVEPGECVITSGGRLPARFVIHAAVMGQDLRTSGQLIDRATRNALNLAAARQLATAAFPAFGTGVGGFPLAECGGSWSRRSGRTRARNLARRVRLVLFGKAAYLAFAEVAGELLGAPMDGPPECPISS
jgi:O-acetyl-ADP-ribose deacetylase (regulator of RNase III)